MSLPAGYIYALHDPQTGRPRYVGMTRGFLPGGAEPNLLRRLGEHLHHHAGSNPGKSRWLLGLLHQGLTPGIQLLETVEDGDPRAAENRWVQYLRNRGEDLLNAARTGTGRPASRRSSGEQESGEKSPMLRLAEIRFNCTIEEYIERCSAQGWSVPAIAASIGVTPVCLRAWIRQFGGSSRIQFPRQSHAEMVP